MGIIDILFKPNVERLKAKRDLRGLIKVLGYERGQWVRKDSARALGELGDARAVEPLIIALKDKDEFVVSEAAEALGKLGDTRAVLPLTLLLKHRESFVRSAAARSLGKLGDSNAVESLTLALDDKDEFVHDSAARALQTLMLREEANKLIKESQRKRAEAEKPMKESQRTIKETQRAVKDKELKAVRKYLHHLAMNWWANQPDSQKVALCDACGSRDVNRGEGYLIGSHLWCDSCYFDKKVESQIEQDPDRSLGRGVFQKALEMFEGESDTAQS